MSFPGVLGGGKGRKRKGLCRETCKLTRGSDGVFLLCREDWRLEARDRHWKAGAPNSEGTDVCGGFRVLEGGSMFEKGKPVSDPGA